METRQLGNSDLQITTLGFGTFALGGEGWLASWGPQDDKESIAAIHRGLDLGMNWIDTAAVYGIGHAEEIVGQVLKERSDRPYIFTKCSRLGQPDGSIKASLKSDSIRRELEGSLKRLGVDVIDLYQIHWPQPDEDIEEGWTTMAELQKQGKVRYIGVSNFNAEQMRRAQAIAPITSLQPPYSLINRSVEPEILPYCLQNHIGVIIYSPMQSGLLTGTWTPERVQNLPKSDWRSRNPQFQEPHLSRNIALANLLRAIGQRHDRAPGEVAIAWTLHNPAVTAAIVGARHPGQLDGIMGAADFKVSESELAEIQAFVEAHP